MTQIFGDFREELPKSEQFLLISFSPGSIPLKQRWRNNGLSADFVADYLVTFFPVSHPVHCLEKAVPADDSNSTSEDEVSTLQRQAELKSAVSYIANELLENAMKFHDKTSKNSIQFGIHLLEKTVILFSINCISTHHLQHFYPIIKALTTSDPAELYIQQLEKLAEDDSSKASGMGLITIMHDYLARLGWKIEPLLDQPSVTTVTTMVQLNV